ncbi:MAG TPA: DnaA regulatory inactivator Hda [Steroidobacteraceae bacterium]|nr:DnaA regulatory inactivator Hda [Steroidobacteraceae bacterium]
MQQLPLAVRLRASAVFDSFVAGPNAEIVDLLERLAPRPHAPLVWLYGPAGVGRTHLLQAVCARAGERQRRAAYVPLREFAAAGPEALAGLEVLDFICLDDFDAVAADPAWVRAVFGLFIALQDAGGRLLIAAAASPRASGIELPDFVSRAAGGAVLKLRPLTEDQQLEALRRRAAQRGLVLSPAVARFLQLRLPRDTATLCAAVDALDEASLAAGRRLTLPFVRTFVERMAVGGGAAGSVAGADHSRDERVSRR